MGLEMIVVGIQIDLARPRIIGPGKHYPNSYIWSFPSDSHHDLTQESQWKIPQLVLGWIVDGAVLLVAVLRSVDIFEHLSTAEASLFPDGARIGKARVLPEGVIAWIHDSHITRRPLEDQLRWLTQSMICLPKAKGHNLQHCRDCGPFPIGG